MKVYTEDQVRTMIAQALEMGRQLPPDTCRVTVAGMFYKLGVYSAHTVPSAR